MYTRSQRNYDRQSAEKRYTPPPGYVGTAFSENTGVKHHIPEQNIEEFTTRRDESVSEEETLIEENSLPEEETLPDEQRKHEEKPHEVSPLESLVESLRGRIGTEELIILMTMFLISSDGICVEALILALVLAAGNESKK